MATDLQVVDLRFEHHPNGLGLQSSAPRLSWRFKTSSSTSPISWKQYTYEISVRRGSEQNVKVFQRDSSSNILVPWPDEPLTSSESASVRVKALGISEGKRKVEADWSEWKTVESSLLKSEDWTAKCISAPPCTGESHPDGNGIRPVRFRKTFQLFQTPTRARLYITALGLYEAYVNGVRVGDGSLAPGWTAYQKRIPYQVLDVAPLLRPGESNIISVEVGEGWYAGRLLWKKGLTCFWGDRIGVLAQLDVFEGQATTSPGFRLVTDETWACQQSPIVSSTLYDGEVYDLRCEVSDWHRHDGGWADVDVLEFPSAELVASSYPPVRVTESVKPVKVFRDPDGKTLVDFGQNLVGKLMIHSLSKPDGHRVSFRHAEVLENGRLGVRPLRTAKQTDTIIFGGGRPLKDWSPHFTYHGFRYVELEGWDADEVTSESLSALVMHTDMKRTGSFSCSNDEVNQLYRNVVWSMRGNFVSIPTDCPQRDERLGWTGDIQIFSPTASYIYECMGMLSSWMRDLLIDQKEAGGIVPLIVPNVMPNGPFPVRPFAVWDDVVILVPWTLYQWFGDVQVLREAYAGMQDYLRSVKRGPDGLWDVSLWQLGDWLDPNAPSHDPGLARTDGVLVADAYLVHVTGIMSRISGILGLSDDTAQYSSEAARLKANFQDKYITKAGLVVSDSQTGLSLAVLFGLHSEPSQRHVAGERLARLVRSSKFRVSTGFAGTPVILHALSATGHTPLAYRMLLETECPSWLYPVRMGATTVWERWDSMLPDGTINPGEMTSFNHYALGSVADWMHTRVGGISPLEPGWRGFKVSPRPGGGISSAKAEFLSQCGLVTSEWTVGTDGTMVLELIVPPNSTALVALPDGSEEVVVGSGVHKFKCRWGLDGELK